MTDALEIWQRRQRKRQRVLRLVIASVFFGGVVLIGLAWPRTPPPLPSQAQEARIPVRNLDCPIWCPVRVDTALSSLTGVGSTALDFHRGEVIVQFDPGRVNVAQLQVALAEWSFSSRGPAQTRPLHSRRASTTGEPGDPTMEREEMEFVSKCGERDAQRETAE